MTRAIFFKNAVLCSTCEKLIFDDDFYFDTGKFLYVCGDCFEKHHGEAIVYGGAENDTDQNTDAA